MLLGNLEEGTISENSIEDFVNPSALVGSIDGNSTKLERL